MARLQVAHVEENTAAGGIELSAPQIERLNNLTPGCWRTRRSANIAIIEP